MKRIILICSGGMSTSFLVSKMHAAAVAEAFECEIEAYGMAAADAVIPAADVVLLGPQIRYYQEKLLRRFPNKPIAAIDMHDYGCMNGQAVLKQAKTLMKLK
ncbi:PTS sugar transporter subunit IIB [Dielma fastidiosa]|uniref:PTS system N,N'-diacetylchitobiose-specific IIB component (Lac family) n=1 Tax=Dielma fastidiosa TaxID=1034346 RepID=A0A318KH11_9FIRM|nr:PTS sugar transporter subunit IIB [Dielma fastidiosa]PXX77111.1 PTS system N,N'-diacetylchitobiose-specific IIB component (Lac family) [Dielma fastidiosa]